jgi:hypothetical protein
VSSQPSSTDRPAVSSSTPGVTVVQPSSSAKPPIRPSDAASAPAQTTPRPAEHEPPANGPETKRPVSPPQH